MKLADLVEDLAAKVEAASDAAAKREAIKGWLLAQKDALDEMYEEEDRPIVVNQPAPGDLAVGDYVFASRRADCDPCDPWCVGHVSELGPDFVVVGDASQRRWPKAMRISNEQGRRIIEHYPSMEDGYKPRDFRAIALVFGMREGN